MLTYSLFITYHRFVIIVDMYIDSLQPLVYYRLNTAVRVYTPVITPLAVYMLGVLHKNRGGYNPLGVWINP